jgi:hypothetical protein
LPALLFGALGALQALLQIKLWPRTAGVRGWLAAAFWGIGWGSLVPFWFGGPDSYTWLDRHTLQCFSLFAPVRLDPVPATGDWISLPGNYERLIRIFVACPAGVVAFGVAALALQQRVRWAREFRGDAGRHELWFRLATVCVVSSALWSLSNEMPAWPSQPFGRQACNPELGSVAIAGFLVAAWGYRKAFMSQRMHLPNAPASPRLRAAVILTALLLAGQSFRSAFITYGELRRPVECGCQKRLP